MIFTFISIAAGPHLIIYHFLGLENEFVSEYLPLRESPLLKHSSLEPDAIQPAQEDGDDELDIDDMMAALDETVDEVMKETDNVKKFNKMSQDIALPPNTVYAGSKTKTDSNINGLKNHILDWNDIVGSEIDITDAQAEE